MMKASDSNTNPALEGVIKFNCHHRTTAPLPDEASRELRAWFLLCRQTGLLGQDPHRYEGLAYGNLSCRWQNGFVITCTQTSGHDTLNAQQFSFVEDVDITANRLTDSGPCQASSEAMTHAAIYQALPQVNAVFHAHAPAIWRQAKHLGLTATAKHIEYGTPEMARAVQALVCSQNQAQGIFSMDGHEDGIVSYAPTIEAAGCLMLATLARAYALS